MSGVFTRVQRDRQDIRLMTEEAFDLRAQDPPVPYSQIAKEFGVPKSSLEQWVKTSPRMTCSCGERLVVPVPDDRCGFCAAEAVPA